MTIHHVQIAWKLIHGKRYLDEIVSLFALILHRENTSKRM